MKKPIAIHELRRGQCKFPVTPHEAPKHFFCGEPVEHEGVVYCAEHAALCYDRRDVEARRIARERAIHAQKHRTHLSAYHAGPRAPTSAERLRSQGGTTRDDLP